MKTGGTAATSTPVTYRLGAGFAEADACAVFSQMRKAGDVIAFIADYDSGRLLFLDGPVDTFSTASSEALLADPNSVLTLCGIPTAAGINALHEEMGPAQALTKLVRPAGRPADAEHFFHLSARGVRWHGRPVIAGSLRGHHPVGAQDENAALFHTISQSHEGMALTDRHGHFVFMNAAHARLFGYESPLELLGQSWRSLYTASGVDYIESVVIPGLATAGDWHGHVLALRRNGTLFHQDLTLSLLPDGRLVCNCRDRSSEVEHFERVTETNNLFREFLNTLPDGVLVRPVDGPYEFVNAAVCQILGIAAEAIIGRPNLQSILGQDATLLMARQDRHVTQTGRQVQFDFPLTLGGRKWILEVRKLPLFFGHPHPTHVCTLIADVTERRRMEGVERATAQKRQEYMEMQREFISMVSHEFRTPITVIQGAHYMLMRNLEAAPEPGRSDSLKLLELQKRALATLKEQVDQVLLLNRVEHLKPDTRPTDVALADLVQRIVDNFNSAIPSSRVVLENQLPDAWRTAAHETALRGAVENLISNSLKYSPDDARVTVRLSTGKSEYTVMVTDLGRGIPEADQAKLFQPFFRAGNVGRVTGTGLGLTIVKRVADLHGGRVEYQSVLGQGSTFRIILPCAPPTSS